MFAGTNFAALKIPLRDLIPRGVVEANGEEHFPPGRRASRYQTLPTYIQPV